MADHRLSSVLLATLVAASSAGIGLVPNPGQNDAGTGHDAADARQQPTVLREGNWTGLLRGVRDDADRYRFDPPPGVELFEVEVNASQPLDITLRTPDGNERYETGGFFNDSKASYELAPRPNGSWTLSLNDRDEQSDRLPYRLRLTYEDHAGLVTLGPSTDRVPVIHINDTDPAFTHVEIYDYRPAPETRDGAGVVAALQECRPWSKCEGVIFSGLDCRTQCA